MQLKTSRSCSVIDVETYESKYNISYEYLYFTIDMQKMYIDINRERDDSIYRFIIEIFISKIYMCKTIL